MLSLLIFTMTLFSSLTTGEGTLERGLFIESQLMGTKVNYNVYLPAGYDTSSSKYPVLYLLHGYSDNENGWADKGDMLHIVNDAITSGALREMVIIMPDGGTSFYINDQSGKIPWEDMFIREFIPQMEQRYKIGDSKKSRSIAGLSMGGFGATVLSMRHPSMFQTCVAFSSAYRTDEDMMNVEEDKFNKYGIIYGTVGKTGKDRINQHFLDYSPFHYAELHPEDLKTVRWYIDCGDDDYLSSGNATMHLLFKKLSIPHEYRVRDGAHNWKYWQSGLKDGLLFIQDGL